MLNTNFEMEKTMGSKISIQDIDQKASDFAKANFMRQLKEYHQDLEKENKKLTNENKKLKQRNLFLSNELMERNIQIKEWEKERDEVLRECVKLAKLVEELREAIEEPKELDDK